MPHKQTEQVAFTNFFGHCVLTAFVACIKYLCSGKYAATKTEGLPYHPPRNFLPCACNFSHSNEITRGKKKENFAT